MSDNDRPVVGFECKLYYDSADSTASPTWEDIKQAQNVNEPDAMVEAEASCKASKRKRYVPGQGEAAIEFDYLFIKGGNDEVWNWLNERYHGRDPVHVAAADGEIDVAGTYYQRDWYTITKFEPKQELENVRIYSVVLKPTIHMTSGVIDEYSYELVEAP